MGQFSNSFPKQFSYLCEYAFRFDLSCSFCEYPIIFHCLHCSPSCFDPDSLLLAHLCLGLSWIDSISANKRFSSPKTSSRKPYTSNKQQERQKHSAENTINFSLFIDSIHILFLLYLLLWFWDFNIKNLQDFIKIYRALIKDIFPVAEANPEYLLNRL